MAIGKKVLRPKVSRMGHGDWQEGVETKGLNTEHGE